MTKYAVRASRKRASRAADLTSLLVSSTRRSGGRAKNEGELGSRLTLLAQADKNSGFLPTIHLDFNHISLEFFQNSLPLYKDLRCHFCVNFVEVSKHPQC